MTSVDANQACALFVENTAGDLDLPIRSIRMTAKNSSKCVNILMSSLQTHYNNGVEEFETIKSIIETRKILRPEGWFIFEHTEKIDFSSNQKHKESRKYGSSVFSFFQFTD